LEELRNPSREKQKGSMEFTSTTFKGLNALAI
jgi:NADH dehydrogenase FAD-containing subunit